MTQNGSSHSSETPSLPGEAVSWPSLSRDRDRLDRVLALLQGPAWPALTDLLEAERHRYLDGLAYSKTPEEFTRTRSVVMFLDHLTQDLKAEITEMQAQLMQPDTAPPGPGENPYMDADSEGLPVDPTA